ncbi:hypothetical protein RFI_05139 [Reticulomyxa filosa]|uniref:Uncharacterized protein n=1 Tax=Reticulomyxa filosa TaxID=46433 RepID=X6P1F9_RETFI|nr:hypothetical protein RFI_05139 [Reticulomyxa filosa]|eukprot:ETO31978.1 hypothetical protein RFI_05139 [Reticulomyxa filosa]
MSALAQREGEKHCLRKTTRKKPIVTTTMTMITTNKDTKTPRKHTTEICKKHVVDTVEGIAVENCYYLVVHFVMFGNSLVFKINMEFYDEYYFDSLKTLFQNWIPLVFQFKDWALQFSFLFVFLTKLTGNVFLRLDLESILDFHNYSTKILDLSGKKTKIQKNAKMLHKQKKVNSFSGFLKRRKQIIHPPPKIIQFTLTIKQAHFYIKNLQKQGISSYQEFAFKKQKSYFVHPLHMSFLFNTNSTSIMK